MFDLFEDSMNIFENSDDMGMENENMDFDMEDIFGGDFDENNFDEEEFVPYNMDNFEQDDFDSDSENDFKNEDAENEEEFVITENDDSEEDFENETDFMITENEDFEEDFEEHNNDLEADISFNDLFFENSSDISDDPYAVPAYIAFDPDSADNIIGNPEEVMDNWHMQETSSSCAVAAQEFALEQLTGQEFDEAELRELASENGWYDINGGTSLEDVGNILEYYGLDVERGFDKTIDDIEHCLERGGQVIVGVDSDEIWFGKDNDFFFPGNDADHAIQVIGIDRSDTDNPMVILNDSGVSNGAGAKVPLDLFLCAWEDSGNFLVEAYK